MNNLKFIYKIEIRNKKMDLHLTKNNIDFYLIFFQKFPMNESTAEF